MKDLFFPDRIEENPKAITHADLIIGIPSYNEVDSISFPTAEADKGLKEFYPDRKTVIINCDNFSTDGTKEIFLSVPTETPKIYLSTPKGVKGKGNNLLNLLQRSLELGAKAVIIIDADLKSITPRWIHSLAEPLFKGFSFVAPLYARHKYEGTITSNIVYPLTRALYGRRVRQPIGGDFGIGADLIEVLLKEPLEDYARSFGIDIWMNTIAATSGVKICQSFLGGPKIHKSKDPDIRLISVFKHNVGTIFPLMERFQDNWKMVRWSKPTAIFGYDKEKTMDPQEVKIDIAKFHANFKDGFSRFEKLWGKVFHKDVFRKLQEVKDIPFESFEFPILLWAMILFDFAVAFKRKAAHPDQLLESLIPLYFGYTSSYAIATSEMTSKQADEYIEDRCQVFEEAKLYLLQQWEKA